MNAFIDKIYFASGGHVPGATYYFRVVRRDDGTIYNKNTNLFSSSTSWADSANSMDETGTTGQFPVVIPASFPVGTFDIAVYSQLGSSPANTDDVVDTHQSKIGDIFGF